jgi:hypothetical protein
MGLFYTMLELVCGAKWLQKTLERHLLMSFSFRTGASGPLPGLHRLQEGDAAQVARDHSQSQPAFHSFPAVIPALAPAIVPPQARDPSLNSRSPPIATSKGWPALPGSTFLCCFAERRDGHLLDPSGLELFLRLGKVDPAIGCDQTRRPGKKVLVVGDRFNSLSMLFRVLQDLGARDQPSLHLVERDQSSKLDKRTALVARNRAGMWLNMMAAER